MDDAQDGVAVRDGIHDDPDRDQIIDLIEGFLLQHHLAVDGIEMLGAAVDVVMNALGIEALGKLGDDQADAFLPLCPFHADQVDNAVVSVRVDIFKRKILQLLLQGIHAQAVSQGA